MKGRLLRYWTYFRRGHNIYLMFLLSFLNFIVIQWNLLISGFAPLANLFQNLLIFSIIFFIAYIPTSTVIGWADYKRGAVAVDQVAAIEVNPYYQDLAKAILLLAEGKNEEIAEIMNKWTRK